MLNLRQRFTEWYYCKGYRMNVSLKGNTVKLIFNCPLLVRPLTYYLFSPIAYYRASGY